MAGHNGLGLNASQRLGLLGADAIPAGIELSRESPGLRLSDRASTQPDIGRDIKQITALAGIAAVELASLPFDMAALPGTLQRFNSRVSSGKVRPTFGSVLSNLGAASDEALREIPGGKTLMNVRSRMAAQASNAGVTTFQQFMASIGAPDLGDLAMVGPLFHGGAKKFDKFSREFIGTGEGAQAFGYGHYFAENPGVAKGYRFSNQRDELLQDIVTDYKESLKGKEHSADSVRSFLREMDLDTPEEAARFNMDPDEIESFLRSNGTKEVASGSLIETVIDIDTDDLLDWDKPLSEQSEKVRAALESVMEKRGVWYKDADTLTDYYGNQYNANGQGAYNALAHMDRGDAYTGVGRSTDDAAASHALHEAGIPGIRYLDQGNRDPFGSPQRIAQRQAAARIRQLESGEAGMSGKVLEQQLALARKELDDAERGITRNIVVFPDAEDKITITKINGEPVK